MTIVLEWRQEVIDQVLADSGEAILARMNILRSYVATGREFGMSCTAIRGSLPKQKNAIHIR